MGPEPTVASQQCPPGAARARPWVDVRPVPGAACTSAADGDDLAETLSRHLEAKCFHSTDGGTPQASAAEPLRVVTWNVWFDDHHKEQRWSALLAEALSLLPDVLCLQEVTVRVLYHPSLLRMYQLADACVGRPPCAKSLCVLCR